MFLVNSRFSLVSAAINANPQGVSRIRPPFSRSYGGILPNSLTTIHSIALVFSTQPPESVWGTGGSNLARNFSWQHRITLLPAYAVTIKPRALMGRIYHSPALRSSTWTTIATRRLPSCVLPSLTYYQLGSRARPDKHTTTTRAVVHERGVRALSITGFGTGRFFAGSGISTGCPSTTPVGLALGPDLPRAD